MPGKINPTQCEMVIMVCSQVIGNDAAITTAVATLSNLELCAANPLLAHALLQSIRLLGDACRSFAEQCVRDIKPNLKKLQEYSENSLMIVTALSPHIGYDQAAAIAKTALEKDISVRQAAVESGLVTKEEFANWTKPAKIV